MISIPDTVLKQRKKLSTKRNFQSRKKEQKEKTKIPKSSAYCEGY